MRRLIVVAALLGLTLGVARVTPAAVDFSGQSIAPPLTGSYSFDTNNLYVTGTVQDAAITLDEDYFAIAIDANNDDLWTEGLDAILVYDFYNNDGPSWRVVDQLEYAGGPWDCPWSSSDKRKPGDSDWPEGLQIQYTTSGNDLIYSATIPFSAMGVAWGDTIGMLVQTRDKNMDLYGPGTAANKSNGKVINYWPDSTCFNKLYDPSQFADVSFVPEPASVIVWGLLGAVVAFAGAWVVRRRS